MLRSVEGFKPRFAILLAAYNGVAWLQEQISSILSQQDVDVTIFISVDISSDDTEGFVSKLMMSESRIILLPVGERFGGAARNFFRLIKDVDFSNFDYVSFSDQDDIWLPQKLIRSHQVMVKESVDGYSSNVIAFWPSCKKIIVNKSQSQKKWDFLFEAAGPGCTYVMSQKLATDLRVHLCGCWDKAQHVILHDWFAYAFARANNYRWFIDSQPGMLYRQHAENQVGVNFGVKAFWYRAKKIFTVIGLTQSRLIANLVGLDCHPFVKKWSQGKRSGLISLALHAHQCRRRSRDQIFFALVCLVFATIRN